MPITVLGRQMKTPLRPAGRWRHKSKLYPWKRVWKELARLLLAPDPAATIDLMATNGVLTQLLPEMAHRDRLPALIKAETATETAPDYLRRLAAIVDLDEVGARALAARLKFSNADRDQLCRLCDPVVRPDPGVGLKQNRVALYRLGAEIFNELVLVGAAQNSDQDWLSLYSLPNTNSIPPFYITGAGCCGFRGPPPEAKLVICLEQVENWWIAGDFAADRESVPRIFTIACYRAFLTNLPVTVLTLSPLCVLLKTSFMPVPESVRSYCL